VNRRTKFLLFALGLGLIGYALYYKTAMIWSPQSARENLLVNTARQGEDTLIAEFRRVMHAMGPGWNVVAVAGGVIVAASCFIKTRSKVGPKED
jgi:hypothetical protein